MLSSNSKIFLSYSHQDQKFATELTSELSRKGLVVWRDVEEIGMGELIPMEVSNALSQCRAFCVLITNHSMSSHWVKAELSAAFMRWVREPWFKIIPIVIDEDSLPSILSGMNYINAISLKVKEIVEKISQLLEESKPPELFRSIDWNALLVAIEDDQFTEDRGSHQYGGWSKSYSINYLPLAFPDQVPVTVSAVDSVTVTHWVVRGLCSLRRILMITDKDNNILNRIEKLLAHAQNYLIRHFDGRGAGVIRSTAEGERIYTDVRHSAAFAKAMLEFKNQPLEKTRKAIEFALSNIHLSDQRIPSFGEIYHLIGLVKAYPELRSQKITPHFIRECQSEVEARIIEIARICNDNRVSGRLVGHSNQWHMAPYYSWWLLDACGELMVESDDEEIQKLTHQILKGLNSLEISNNDGSAGYPLSLEGSPDLGASAQIGELLLRFSPHEYTESINLIANFLCKRITLEYLKEYIHHEFLWAIPHFFERYLNIE